MKQRLQRILAAAGVDSRRNCEELILQGAVKVNGARIDSLPAFADPDVDKITVRGKPLAAVEKVYYLLNKPRHVICTNSDPQGRRRAIDFVPARQRVFCAGRLDTDTAGAIIITNDTELSNRLTHPKYELPKTYMVRIKGRIEAEAVDKLRKGIWLAEAKAKLEEIKVLKSTADESLAEVVLVTAVDRQIQRMFAKVGIKVKGVTRTAIGKITIKGLAVGESRMLTKGEIGYLRKVTGMGNE
jgi:23S rRNA pseudouridine2605 synthase